MKDKIYWTIIFNDIDYHFVDYATAKASFEKLCEKYSKYAEFERKDNSCSWYNSDYDEYSDAYLLKKLVVVNTQVINW